MATSRKTKIAGWILSGLVAAFLIGPSAMGKFVEWEGKTKMFEHLGYSSELMVKIGVLEVIVAILFLIPRTGFVGAILVTGYLGGATTAHVRIGDAFVFPIVIGMLMWLALGMRRPEVFSLAFGSTCPDSNPSIQQT